MISEGGKTSRIGDLEGRTTFTTLGRAVRVVWAEERTTFTQVVGGQKQEVTEDSAWVWVTDLSSQEASASTIQRMGHDRWDVENRAFNELGQHWGMDHSFGALLTLALGCDGGGGSGAEPAPPPPPPEYEALYSELAQTLSDFEAQLDAQWDGTARPTAFAGALAAANGNSTIGLLTGSAWTRITEMLDAYQATGVGTVKIEVHDPVFTQAFHDWLAANPPPPLTSYPFTAADFIGSPTSFYNRLAAEIRGRGLGLWVEHATLFAAFSPTPPGGYFAEMRSLGLAACRQRYRDERAAEGVAIVQNLAPDRYTLVQEPDTQNANFGYFPGPIPLYTPDLWEDYTRYAAQQIGAAVTASETLLGAGSGTWSPREYVERFAGIAEIDYIDIHIYPLRTDTADFLQPALDWADYVRGASPSKGLTIGEAWLYKVGAAAGGGGDPFEIYGRDAWIFWEPLDRQFLEVLYKIAQVRGYDGVMPFRAQYFFHYLTYGDPALAGRTGSALIAEAGRPAQPFIQSVTLTGTGRRFREILSR